jgi:hypothetical protein
MNNNRVCKIATICTLIFFLIFGANAVNAGKDKSHAHIKSSTEVSDLAVTKEKKRADEIKQEFNQKAIKAVADTYKVIDLLDNGKKKQELELLKSIIGELEIVLAANKDVSLIPINSYTLMVDVDMSSEEIVAQIEHVKTMLDNGDIQNARILLDTLQSEIDIVIENLPLATYPDAMKLASKYIIDGKLNEAKHVMTIALNSMIVKKIIVPLPLVRAADLVDATSKIAQADKEQALKYLAEAEEEIKIAQVLGYGQDNPAIYDDLEKRIASIRKEIKGKNKAEKMLDELMNKLKAFKEKIMGS